MKRNFGVLTYPIVNQQSLTAGQKPVVTPRYGYHDHFLMVSESHDRNDLDGKYHSGGPFYVTKQDLTLGLGPLCSWRFNGVNATFTPYVGNGLTAVPVERSDAVTSQQHTTDNANAFSFGATGWNRARPGNPVASIATFVGELREGLPRIPLNLFYRLKDLLLKKRTFRQVASTPNLGDEWLNVVFGWKPLLADIRKMYELQKTLDRRLAQIVRENGKGVHKRRVIKDSISVNPTTTNYAFPFGAWQNPGPSWASGRSSMTTITTNIEKVWFVGKFRYYIPDIGTSEWSRRTTALLFGAKVTPEVVWNLLPWSWLADWFGNVGDVMSNLSSNAVEGLTADYAYIMRTVETRTQTIGVTSWNTAGTPGGSTYIPGGSAVAVAESNSVSKTRTAGSPFGFGVKYESLSTFQLGVAAALGLSRW